MGAFDEMDMAALTDGWSETPKQPVRSTARYKRNTVIPLGIRDTR